MITEGVAVFEMYFYSSLKITHGKWTKALFR